MSAANMVPKIHPMERGIEADDPMELMASAAPGDPDEMLDCIIQEFAWQGNDAGELLRMFLDPEYPVLNQLLDWFGPDELRSRIDNALTGFDAFSVRTSMEETVDPDDDHEELMELTVRSRG